MDTRSPAKSVRGDVAAFVVADQHECQYARQACRDSTIKRHQTRLTRVALQTSEQGQGATGKKAGLLADRALSYRFVPELHLFDSLHYQEYQ